MLLTERLVIQSFSNLNIVFFSAYLNFVDSLEAEVDVADDDGSVGRQLVKVGAGVCRGQGQEDGG